MAEEEIAVRQQPFHFIWEAEWYDIADTDYPLTPERWVTESCHHLIGTQVDCLTYNLWSSDHAVAHAKPASPRSALST